MTLIIYLNKKYLIILQDIELIHKKAVTIPKRELITSFHNSNPIY